MTYQIEWEISKRVILITYTDKITLEDLQGVNRDLEAFHEEGIAPIHVISYLKTNKFPTHIKTIREVMNILSYEKWGWYIVAGFENSLGRFLMVMITNAFKVNAKATTTLEEGVEILHRVDATLISPGDVIPIDN